jgi:hypothetical protein
MLRRIVLSCAALLLSGCVTYPTYTYDDGRNVQYVDDATYYVEAGNGYGDYYASDDDPWRYSAYYSLYWPIHRLYWDSYWYPDFYYGITYFPRDYFHVGWGGVWGPYRPYRGYQHWYAPYRYSWPDNHYAWYWHRSRPQVASVNPAPRFGHARNEAERVSAYQQGGAFNRALRSDQAIGTSTRMGLGGRQIAPSRAASDGRGDNSAIANQRAVPARPAASEQRGSIYVPRPSREAATDQRRPYLSQPTTRSTDAATSRGMRPTEPFLRSAPSLPAASTRSNLQGRPAQFERPGSSRPLPTPSPRYAPAPRVERSFTNEPARQSAPVSRSESPARSASREAHDEQ